MSTRVGDALISLERRTEARTADPDLGLPEEPTSDPALAKFPGYWCGSAAGQLALVRAEAAYWKNRALQAEKALVTQHPKWEHGK